jgi:ABC-type multidrug transport system, ATPase and permease components
MTTLIISQRIVSVADADRIVVLNDGRIDGIGTSEDLLASNEIYKEIYDSQTGGEDLAASDEASDHNSVISHAFDGKPEKGGVK